MMQLEMFDLMPMWKVYAKVQTLVDKKPQMKLAMWEAETETPAQAIQLVRDSEKNLKVILVSVK